VKEQWAQEREHNPDQSREIWEFLVKKIGIFPRKLVVDIGVENTTIHTRAERVAGWCLLEIN
jgi:hypothetical protein